MNKMEMSQEREAALKASTLKAKQRIIAAVERAGGDVEAAKRELDA